MVSSGLGLGVPGVPDVRGYGCVRGGVSVGRTPTTLGGITYLTYAQALSHLCRGAINMAPLTTEAASNFYKPYGHTMVTPFEVTSHGVVSETIPHCKLKCPHHRISLRS